MFRQWERYCKETDRAEMRLRPLVALAVQLLVLQLGRALFACLLVMLAMDLLAVDAAVFHKVAGRAVLQLDGVTPFLAAVGADLRHFRRRGRGYLDAAHLWN